MEDLKNKFSESEKEELAKIKQEAKEIADKIRDLIKGKRIIPSIIAIKNVLMDLLIGVIDEEEKLSEYMYILKNEAVAELRKYKELKKAES